MDHRSMDPSSSRNPPSRRVTHKSDKSTNTHKAQKATTTHNAATLAVKEPGALAFLLARNRLFWSNRVQTVNKVTKVTKPAAVGTGNSNKKQSVTQTTQSEFTQTEKRKKAPRKSTRSVMHTTVNTSRETLVPMGHLKPSDLTARCSATHEGRKLLQERLMVRVDSLFNMLFSASTFLQNFHDRRKSTDLCMGGWTRNAAGLNERVVTVTVALQANLGPKTARVTETQVMRECSQPGQLYSIDVHSVNEDIPYADTFVVLLHFCLRATVDHHTDVMVFAQVKFLKSVWAVVKAFIEKNAYAGLEEFCQSLYSALLNEIKKI